MIITALAAIVYAPKRHRRWVTIVLILGAIGGFILSDDWFWIRMGTILETGEERDQSAAIRLIIWEAAWDLFKDNPLGVGVGQFQFQIKNYAPALQNRTRDAHNSYILAACEMGLFGFMTYIGTLGLSWWSLGRASKRARNRLADPEIFEFFIFANRLSLLVYMISGLFVSRLYTEGAWWFIVMPVCISRAIENEIRDEAREAMALQAQLPKWLETGGLPQLAPQ
jgi:O-antigen ligase